MARTPHGMILLVLGACRPPEAETTTTPAAGVEARANEVRGRLLAECEAGDVSACRRIGIEPTVQESTGAAPEFEQADVPAVDGQPVGVIFGSFPGFVAGLPSYGTPLEVADACAQRGGLTVAFRLGGGEISIGQIADGDVIACSPPPVDPFGTFNETIAIGVKFCEWDEPVPIACEMAFVMRDAEHADAKEILGRLEGKYGPGGDYPPEFSCADPRQAAMEYRRSWGFIEEVEGQRMAAGRIVTGYFCDVTNPGKRAALALIYQNALGYMRRVEQMEQRKDSF